MWWWMFLHPTISSLTPAGLSYNSTQFSYYLHRISIRFHKLWVQYYKIAPIATSNVNWNSRLSPGLLTDPGYRLAIPITFSLCLANLWEWLSGLRGPVYSLDHWFIMKGDNSGADRWKIGIGQGMEKGLELPCSLGANHFPHIFTCSPTQKLSKLHPWMFLWRLCYINMIDQVMDHWWLIQPPGPLPFLDWDWNFSASRLALWQPAFILRYVPKVTSSA